MRGCLAFTVADIQGEGVAFVFSSRGRELVSIPLTPYEDIRYVRIRSSGDARGVFTYNYYYCGTDSGTYSTVVTSPKYYRVQYHKHNIPVPPYSNSNYVPQL